MNQISGNLRFEADGAASGMQLARPGTSMPAEVVLLGRALRARRLLAGLTLGQVADRLGVSYQQVQKYETGRNRIGSIALNRFAALCGLSMDALLADAGVSALPEAPPQQSLRAARQESALIEAFRQIGRDSLRCTIVELTRAAADSGDYFSPLEKPAKA